MSEPGISAKNHSNSLGDALHLDEGDALLGKRTIVKDSSDRFANIELAQQAAPPTSKSKTEKPAKRP